MSYDSAEISNYDGVPTILYEFLMGTNAWRYASGEQDVTYVGNAFTAVPISDSGIVQSGDVNNDDFTVTMPDNVTLAVLFIATPPSAPIYLRVRRMNRGETDAPIVWVGTVKSAKHPTIASLAVVCKVLTSSLDRNGLRLSWGRGCQHALYDRNCCVDPDDFGIAVAVDSLTGGTFTSSGLAAVATGYLAGGYLEWELLPGVMERRAIDSHAGTTVTVLGTTDGLEAGQMVTVYPGCDRVTLTCQTKFNNLANYGGFPHMPGKSPFDGDPVF
ncbi:MAG: phage BR0599 family protein [Bradyrhizobium sp.]|nr:phage BR0599 family protein [Bradyrhizobium sp.]